MIASFPLRDFFPEPTAAALSKLEQSLSATRDLPGAQIQLESFLLSRITAQKSNPRLIAALKRLCETPEQYDVVSAVQDAGLSLRQFERQCIKLDRPFSETIAPYFPFQSSAHAAVGAS